MTEVAATNHADALAELPKLPCFPCPHRAACCAFGVTLSDEEAAEIVAQEGADKAYRTRWGEWRTRVKRGRCVFYTGVGCSLHDKSYYPAVCRGFPFVDAETGESYEFDQTICPEFELRPELTQLGRAALSSSADR